MAHLSKRAIMIRKMHDEGLTYEAIGNILGISKQAVHQAAYPPDNKNDGFRVSTVLKIKYIGLRNWLVANRMNTSELERQCGVSRLGASLIGKCEPSKKSIDAILRVTGLTYEECFKED